MSDKLFGMRISLVDIYGKTGYALEVIASKDRPVQIFDDAADLSVIVENLAKYYQAEKDYEEAHNDRHSN